MIFVDTGAWFASAARNDPPHASAVRWMGRNVEALVTTDYVLAETATLLRMRDRTARRHRLAVRVATTILQSEAAVLEKAIQADLVRGLEVLHVYRDHLFSLIDCTSFVVMERLGIENAFAFDRHFDEYPGISRVPR